MRNSPSQWLGFHPGEQIFRLRRNMKAQIIIAVFLGASLAAINEEGQPVKRLIKWGESDQGSWLGEEELFTLIKSGIHFVDVTTSKFPGGINRTTIVIPGNLRFEDIVLTAIGNIDIDRMMTFVDRLDNFPNRYYNNQNGVDAADWVERMVKVAIIDPGYEGRVTVTKFNHSCAQHSIIARIEGSDPILKDEFVVFGAHFDSINKDDPVNGIAPGANDNASGSVTLFESLRVLIETGFVPKRSIEFQWYSAEEVGLRGSGDIAETYYNQGVKIVAMVNYDEVGFRSGPNQFGLLTDYTSPILTALLRLVIEKYCSILWINHFCGYACSDHASFTRHGYPTACASSYPLSPDIHTPADTADKMSFEQVAEFVKLTVGVAIEIG
ncbi:probable leucine aminopeptidase 1 isoform X2 [Folsomia candida]|uniref:probable leucine aminopeptidase 1 isoform X2 n=1 Tax=Folsomia candida TaxID=158441 RepID=UPI001604A55B|nr:probable leucine aminopeptidase 1 isoform X2 [Folsomia candida]